MFRVSHRWLPLLLAWVLRASPQMATAAGTENFTHFPETGSASTNGSFLGQDGSTWSYVQCRGNKVIQAPTPGLNKGTNLAYVASGILTGGCGTLSFDWMQMFTATVSVDVVVNGITRHTIKGGGQNITNHSSNLVLNVGGNFTLKIQQSNKDAGQVAIDNIVWTSYGGTPPEPPTILFSPDTNRLTFAYSNAIQITVTATEPNVDTVRLWTTNLPTGASFNAATGTAPLISTFSWIPSSAQTGLHSVVFFAEDKEDTSSRTFTIEVTPIYPYYHYAQGLTGAALRAKLHDIISAGARQLTDEQENDAMKILHTDPANTNNVFLLYNPTSSIPKSAYNSPPNGWNKEHGWPESRGLGNEGPDQVDVHNLFAEHIGANALRGNLYFDTSDPADPGYRSPATNVAPETSLDSNSWSPPPASRGNVARAVFYMATRYDGSEPNTSPLSFSDDPTHTNTMGKLSTLLSWHAADPPDAAESNRNEIIFRSYQYNRNPFIDHPEWVDAIWNDDDGDGLSNTQEAIAGTDPTNPASAFNASFADGKITCGLLTTGPIWRLYQGSFQSNTLVWQAVAQTNRLQNGTLAFDIAPTSPATFYHLRATRP